MAKLEKLLGQVDTCRQRLDKIPKLLKRFRQSILSAACSGRLTADWREENSTDKSGSNEDMPDGWENAPFSEFIESSFYGPRFGKEDYAAEGVPTIRTTDIAFDGTIILTDAPRIKLSADQTEKYRLLHGVKGCTRRLVELPKGSGIAAFKDLFHLAPQVFYRVEIRRVRRKIFHSKRRQS